MSSNKCFYLTYFFFIYYFSKMPLRYEQKPSRAFFFFDSHAITEKVRREPYVTSSTQGQLSGQNNLYFHKPQLPAWMGWVRGCIFTMHFSSIIFFF